MDSQRPKDRLHDITSQTPAGETDEQPQVFAIRREGGAWTLSRRAIFGAGLVAPSARTSRASAQARKKAPAAAPDPATVTAPEPARLAHSAQVGALAYSPDGAMLATASADNTIKLWSTADDGLRGVLIGHSGPVVEVAFSRDGRLIVSGSQDRTVNVWSASSLTLLKSYRLSAAVSALVLAADRDLAVAGTAGGEVVVVEPLENSSPQTVKEHARVDGLALSADGRHLISWQDRDAKLWLLGGAVQKVALPGHEHVLKAAAFTPDGTIAITGARDDKVRLWSVPAGTLLKTLTGHNDDVNSVAVTPDGGTMITGSSDGTVRLWSVPEGKLLQTRSGGGGPIQRVCLAKKSPAFAALGGTRLRVHSLPEGQPVLTVQLVQGVLQYQSLAISPDGSLASCGDNLGAVAIADAEGRRFRAYLVDATVSPALAPKEAVPAHLAGVKGILAAPDGQRLVSVADDATLKTWSVADRKPSACVTLPVESEHVAVTPDGVIAAASGDAIDLFLLPEARRLARLEGHLDSVTALGVVGGARLLSAGADGVLRSWSLPDGNPAGIMRVMRRQAFRHLAHTPDGRFVAAGAEEGPIHVWLRGRYVGSLPSSNGRITAMALAADGETLAAAMRERVQLWNLPKLKALTSFSRERDTPGILMFGKDGGTLLVAWGGALEWRSVPAGEVLTAQPGASATRLAMAPDGARAVSGHRDGTARFWSMETRRQSGAVKMPNPIASLAFAAAGAVLATGDDKGNIGLWRVDSPAFLGWLADPSLTDISAPQVLNAHRGSVNGLSISRDGQKLASGGGDDLAKVWSIVERRLESVMEGHKGGVNAVVLLEGDRLLTASADQTARIWSVPKTPPEPARPKAAPAKSGGAKPAQQRFQGLKVAVPRGTAISTLPDHKSSVQGIALAPDGKCAATWTQSATRLWTLPDGKLVKELDGTEAMFGGSLLVVRKAETWTVTAADGQQLASRKEERLEALSLLPDGSAALPAAGGTVRIWLVPSMELSATVEGLPDTVQRVVVSPDGRKLIATGMRPGGLGVWLLPEGRLLAYLGGRSNSFERVRISPDSRVVAASKGGAVYLWDLADLRLIGRLNATAAGNVNQMEFTPDSRVLACAHMQNAISIWDVTRPAFITYLFDPAANTPDRKAISYNVYDQTTGRWITYTLPCGSPIPPGAVCVCNCVPGTGCACVSVSRGGGFGGGRVCTCVPVHYWYPN